ncbi:MAG: response regulator [Nitrospirae bacterium]|nr:response regulator [Nitrospirota bacterium]
MDSSFKSRSNILIVDDDETIVTMLSRFLSNRGYAVAGATSTEEALLLIHKMRFDLIMTDLKMQPESGVELIRKMKETGFHRSIIAFSANPEYIAELKSSNLDVAAIFEKPFDLGEIHGKIEECIRC